MEKSACYGEAGERRYCVVRRGGRRPVARFGVIDGKSPLRYFLLGEENSRALEPFLITLKPGTLREEGPSEHSGEEFLFVLEGKVAITLLDHEEILEVGDSIHYQATLPHRVACAGEEPATVLAVVHAGEEMIIL